MSQSDPGRTFSNFCWNPALAILGLLITWQTAARADELLKLVDADSAICVQVRNLSKHSDQLESSEFATRVANASFFKEWKSGPAYKQLQDAQAAFEKATGTSIRAAVSDIFGTEIVVAVRVTGADGPTGVLITKANDAGAITELLDSWNRLQPQTRTTISYRDISYTKSIVAKNAAPAPAPAPAQNANPAAAAKPIYYVTFDDVLAVSETESMIRRVIELHTSPDAESSIDELETAGPALKRRDQNEVGSFYVNPRAFSQFDFLVPEELRDYWRRMQWVSFRLSQFSNELQLDFVVDYDNVEMPDWWTRLVRETALHKLPLDRIPENALVTVSGHFSSASINALVKQAVQKGEIPDDLKPARRAISGLLLGLDPLDDLLPMMGPTWTFYAVPRDAEKSKTFPGDSVLAVALHDVDGDDDAKRQSRRDGLHNALNVGLNFLTLIHNIKSTKGVSVIRKLTENEITVHYADPVAMFSPAYAITDDYLILATSREGCLDFLQRRTGTRLANSKVTGDSAKQLETHAQLLFANTESIRSMLVAHQEWFVWQARQEKLSEADAQARLQALVEILQIIDGSYVSFGVHSSSLRLTLGAVAVKRD